MTVKEVAKAYQTALEQGDQKRADEILLSVQALTRQKIIGPQYIGKLFDIQLVYCKVMNERRKAQEVADALKAITAQLDQLVKDIA